MHQKIRNIPFELKELKENGEFVGIASVYGNIDHGNDVVEPGAFDKSIAEHGAKVRLMDSHKVRIGVATVTSTPEGLKAVGKINVEKQSGAEAYSDLKFYQEHGQPMGMSIGYETIKATPASKSKDGARHLEEVRLWEVTITEFPMNELAIVTNVKSIHDLLLSMKEREGKTDFDSELQKLQLRAAIYQLEDALSTTLWKIRRDTEIEDQVAASGETIEKFKEGYLSVLPDILAMDAENVAAYGYMSMPGVEEKAGRKLSKATRDAIAKTIESLQSLLASADKSGAETENKSAPPTEDAPNPVVDDNPAELVDLVSRIGSIIPA